MDLTARTPSLFKSLESKVLFYQFFKSTQQILERANGRSPLHRDICSLISRNWY